MLYNEKITSVRNILKEIIQENQVNITVNEILKSLGIMCKEEDCERSSRAKGYCMKHYQSKFRIITYRSD